MEPTERSSSLPDCARKHHVDERNVEGGGAA
jgi:hypothetical protein